MLLLMESRGTGSHVWLPLYLNFHNFHNFHGLCLPKYGDYLVWVTPLVYEYLCNGRRTVKAK